MPLREELRSQGDFLFRYRSYLPLIIVIAGICAYAQDPIDPSQSNREYVYVAISLLGLLVRMVAVGYSAQRTSGRNTSEGQIADSLNTTALYSVCRHPLYVGNFLMWLGIALFTETFWFIVAFILLFALYYERIMYAEEEVLRQTYGDTYLRWAKQTPAVLPNFRQWKTPLHRFDLRKVLRQEKSGIVNLLLTICALKTIGNYIATGQYLFYPHHWYWALLASIIYYIIAKVAQKAGKL